MVSRPIGRKMRILARPSDLSQSYFIFVPINLPTRNQLDLRPASQCHPRAILFPQLVTATGLKGGNAIHGR